MALTLSKKAIFKQKPLIYIFKDLLQSKKYLDKSVLNHV